MSALSYDAIREVSWSDVSLRGLTWTHAGRDVALALTFPAPGPLPQLDMTLHCRWASELCAELAFKADEGGMPLTWDAVFEATDVGWRLELDFANAGRIRLRCAELEWEKA